MSLKNNLFEFWKQKEIEWGRSVTVTEVAGFIGVSRDTIHRAKSGRTTLPDEKTINGLCKFFGCPRGPVPFLIFEPD